MMRYVKNLKKLGKRIYFKYRCHGGFLCMSVYAKGLPNRGSVNLPIVVWYAMTNLPQGLGLMKRAVAEGVSVTFNPLSPMPLQVKVSWKYSFFGKDRDSMVVAFGGSCKHP